MLRLNKPNSWKRTTLRQAKIALILYKENALKTSLREKGNSLAQFNPNYCVIDIETTGLDTRFDDIIEIAALRVRNNIVVEHFNCLIKYDGFTELPDFITQLTGITSENIESEGVPTEIALKTFLDFIADDIVVGHNVNFDINFLYDNILGFLNYNFDNDYIDTLRIARRSLPELKHHRLIDLIKHFSLDTNNLHRAVADCSATKAIFDKCKDILGEDWVYIRRPKSKVNANDFSATITEFDTEHLFYDKHFVFTGKLEQFTRKEAFQIVANFGGHPQNGINKETNFLVVGDTDYSSNVVNGLTRKQKKATEKQLAGQDIQILSETTFVEQL